MQPKPHTLSDKKSANIDKIIGLTNIRAARMNRSRQSGKFKKSVTVSSGMMLNYGKNLIFARRFSLAPHSGLLQVAKRLIPEVKPIRQFAGAK